MQTIAFYILLVFSISNLGVVLANVVLFGFGHGMAAWPLYRIWSVRLFATRLRNTAQGVITEIISNKVYYRAMNSDENCVWSAQRNF